MEDRLRALADAGDLSGPPGEGRPFAREDLEGGGASWAAFRLMKNNRVIPAWSQARLEIDEELDRISARCRGHRTCSTGLGARAAQLRMLPGDRLVAASRITSRADDRFRAELGSAAREVNGWIDRYNAIVPAPSLAPLPISADALAHQRRRAAHQR